MPYVYNWSQDVEKCTLDLVLSSSTRTKAVKATVLASKECPKFLQRTGRELLKPYCNFELFMRLEINSSTTFPADVFPKNFTLLQLLQQG